jgi:hypothetical protein
MSRRVALLGEQPRRKALAFRDPLNFHRDGVNGLIELSELGGDFAGYLRRTCRSPVHPASKGAGKRKSDDDERHREKER